MCKVQINNEEIEFKDIKIVPLFDRVRILGKHWKELAVIETKNSFKLKEKIEKLAKSSEYINLEKITTE